MTQLVLKKPVQFNGKSYETLNFGEPTGITIAECGLPFKSGSNDGDKGGKIDAMAVRLLAAKMADVPQEVIDMLGAMDFVAVSGEVIGFFGDGEVKASSTLISTSDGSGATSA